MRRACLAALTLLLYAAALPAQYVPSSKHIKPQKVHVYPANLVTVASASPLYLIQIMVRTGSTDDPSGKEGTAELVARALIEGGFGDPRSPVTTQKLADITRPWGDAAFPTVLVDKEATTFSMTMPRDSFAQYVDRVLKPMMNQPLWLSQEVERLRRDTLTSIQSGLRFEDEETLGLLALDDYVFSGTPLGRLATGTVKGLQAITAGDLNAFYKKYYTLGNMYVATSINNQGDLSKLVEALPRGEEVYRPANLRRSVVAHGRHVLIITQPNAIATGLHLGYPISLKRTDPEYWPLFVANVFLGAHRDSFGRLYQEVREQRGYNYGDYSYIEYQYGRPQFQFPPPTTPRDQQYFSIWIRPVGHQYAHFIMKAATAELERFARQGMTPDQVADAKVKARALYLNYAESVSRQLGYRLDDLFYGMRDPGYLEQMLDRIDAVTPAQVNAAISKYLQAADLDYVIVTSEAEGEKLADDIPSDANVEPKTMEEYHISQPVAPEKQKLLDQDKAWVAYPLNISRDNIRVVKAAAMFETAAPAAASRESVQFMSKYRIAILTCLAVIISASAYGAEKVTPRGVMIREATIYISPDPNSAKLAQIEPGREVVVLEHSNRWVHVLATLAGQRSENPITEEDSDIADTRDVSGWLVDKGVITAATPNGDQILYGAANDAESEASRRGGRKGAAGDAFFLYLRTQEYFPNSPLAGEALYRAADIKWQLDRLDVMSRPSSHARQSYLREGMNEDLMRQVMKKFPHTKWADRAAFHLIENKLCGDWQGTSSCPKKEADIYEKYARERPDSPYAAEALYDAAWRLAALIQIYKTEEKSKDSEQAKAHALEVAQQIVSKYPQNDWGARAQTLLYMLQQDIPTYGNAVE